MSDFFVWTEEEYGLHVDSMDNEHQQLIAKMNLLYDAVAVKDPYETLLLLVNDLASYTVKHFSDEEAYMEKINFQGLATHKIIHKQLLDQFQGFVEKFKAQKALSDDFFNFLKVWLTGHIKGIDMKYAAVAKKAA
jgi:hemerythrin